MKFDNKNKTKNEINMYKPYINVRNSGYIVFLLYFLYCSPSYFFSFDRETLISAI